jgi:hypothetical protein
MGVISPKFEPRSVNDAVHLIFYAICDNTFFSDSLNPLAVRVNQRDVGSVEGWKVILMKAWPLAYLAIPGLKFLSR